MNRPDYSLEYHQGLGVLVLGPLPLAHFAAVAELAKLEGFDRVDLGISSALAATVAFTNAAAAKRWRALVDEDAKYRARRAAASDDGSDDSPELAWLLGTDTGSSSKTIFSVLSKRWGRRVTANRDFHASIPYDADDFGRCQRLLEAISSWRERLDEVAAQHSEWAPIVAMWGELEACIERGDHEDVYHRIRAVRTAVRA